MAAVSKPKIVGSPKGKYVVVKTFCNDLLWKTGERITVNKKQLEDQLLAKGLIEVYKAKAKGK